MKDFYKSFHPVVEDVQENADRESGERVLGTDPKSGRQVSVRLGKFGPMVQIGTVEEEEKPQFASLGPEQQLSSITFEEAMDLFKLPKDLGTYEDKAVAVNNGRFGPYVQWGKQYISLPKGQDPLSVSREEAHALIEAKKEADAPIHHYENLPVQKGVGRFGPFLKWNNIFINVNKKYDFDNLSISDIETLIEDKKQKEKEKLVQHWPEQEIRLEKARWGRFHLIQGKTKIELPKTTDAKAMSLEQALEILEKNAPKKTKKKAVKKKTAKKK